MINKNASKSPFIPPVPPLSSSQGGGDQGRTSSLGPLWLKHTRWMPKARELVMIALSPYLAGK